MSEFCNVLKQLRQEKGITQKEIAEILGISQAAYSLYEKGQREPKYEMLEKIADFFNVSVGFLVSGRKDYIYERISTPFNIDILELFPEISTITDECEKKQIIKQISDIVNKYFQEPLTLSAHFDGTEYTKDELEEIKHFAEFLKSKRNK